jgi:hypothetical protein
LEWWRISLVYLGWSWWRSKIENGKVSMRLADLSWPQISELNRDMFQVFTDDVAALLERVIAWDGRSWA